MSCATDYDVQFASRFSAEDAEFQRYRERAPDPPPVLEDWRAARGRRDRRVPEQRQHEPRGHHFPDRRNERNSGAHGQRSRY
ncbi:RNA guanine-N7 methyltransferase activating subunit [Carassius gibelio]|uniref:RNA guanine-N7 methyltransferase activating subunit n=1 Tax=Carassius gibelio TaxID=101364 RepID=UPI002277DD59|nr:RNA guanine-N7 methyltransferase activating subunit [Carassius gibelio]